MKNNPKPQLPLNNATTHQPDFQRQKLLLLQGECKIHSIKYLRLNIFKCIVLTMLSAVSVVGLLMLVWFKWFRVRVWFSKCSSQHAGFLYIKGMHNQQIQKLSYQNNDTERIFYFNKLKYRLIQERYVPAAYNYDKNFNNLINSDYVITGLDSQTVNHHRSQYGMNEHNVQIPGYFYYLFHILLQPFFIAQYIVLTANLFQGLHWLTIAGLTLSLLTTSINYILMRRSYQSVKEMAEKITDVRVLRDSRFCVVKSNMLVPGDLIDPAGELMCDCIIIKGDLFVNEVSLTGQNIPIAKQSATRVQDTQQTNRWLYQGSKVVQKHQNVLAMVVYTGFTSRRGKIVRKILTQKRKTPQIVKSCLFLSLQALIIALIIYFSTLNLVKQKAISNFILICRLIDFMGWAFPPMYPLYLNTTFGTSVMRLKCNSINCTEPQKTTQATDLKIMCFDKTGTLTQNQVQINKAYKILDQETMVQVTQSLNTPENVLVRKLFGACHTNIQSEGKIIGDEIDLKMFSLSQYRMQFSNKTAIKFQIIDQNNRCVLEVIRINQFQSKFQSMSVLVFDKQTNTYYIFIKGSPQKIMENSVLKYNQYEQTIASFSLGGYRTIAFGYRRISSDELNHYLQADRSTYQQSLTILGLVNFQNVLKADARETINRLMMAGVETKMITGDNMFIAVQTAVRAGFIEIGDNVLLLQGKKQISLDQMADHRIYNGSILTRSKDSFKLQQIQIKQSEQLPNMPIAVDNRFLQLKPHPKILSQAKLFARISPQNKAHIVKTIKQNLRQEHNKKFFLRRLFMRFAPKVGMCGDGANDLIAIRSSDVGIGINNSDASFAAVFSIQQLLDIDYIIRDSKATTANIVQMTLYYQIISLIKIPSAMLMLMFDTSYFNSPQTVLYLFTTNLIYPALIPFSTPSQTTTKIKPSGNLLSPMNQSKLWGSLLLTTAGLVTGFLYFINSNAFIPNPKPEAIQKWYPKTHSATCMFLLVIVPFTLYPIIFYMSRPWKLPLYKNYFLVATIALCIILALSLHYLTNMFVPVLDIVVIKHREVTIMLGISLAACLISYMYNRVMIRAEVFLCGDVD